MTKKEKELKELKEGLQAFKSDSNPDASLIETMEEEIKLLEKEIESEKKTPPKAKPVAKAKVKTTKPKGKTKVKNQSYVAYSTRDGDTSVFKSPSKAKADTKAKEWKKDSNFAKFIKVSTLEVYVKWRDSEKPKAKVVTKGNEIKGNPYSIDITKDKQKFGKDYELVKISDTVFALKPNKEAYFEYELELKNKLWYVTCVTLETQTFKTIQGAINYIGKTLYKQSLAKHIDKSKESAVKTKEWKDKHPKGLNEKEKLDKVADVIDKDSDITKSLKGVNDVVKAISKVPKDVSKSDTAEIIKEAKKIINAMTSLITALTGKKGKKMARGGEVETYNGWTNYATWRINLELFDGFDNDGEKVDYEFLKELAEEHVDNSQELATSYANAFMDEVNWREIADGINEDIDGMAKGGKLKKKGKKMGRGGSINLGKNEDAVESFLTSTKEGHANRITIHYNEHDKEVLLRQYGTIIAVRKGDKVEITKTKYSSTTSTIQNMIERLAKDKGMDVSRTDKFKDGGSIEGDDWKEEALKDLQEEVDVDDLEIASYDNDYDDYFQVEGGQEYIVFKDFDSAERYTVDYVKEQIESEPEIFTPSWLENHVYVTNTDRRIIAGEEADNRLDDMSDDDIIRDANMEDEQEKISDAIGEHEEKEEEWNDWNEEDKDERGDEPEKVGDLDSYVEDETGYKNEEELVDKAREKLHDEIYDEWYEGLADPIDFLVNEQGIYSQEDLMKTSFVSIDEDEASKDAVDTDGVAHFLSHYDGNEIEFGDGFHAYRTN